jgi:hypothetical protein
MLIEGLLCIVSLSPVRGPGPRATRLGAIADTLGRRARIAVLVAPAHEDAARSLAALAQRNATGGVEAWELPAADHAPQFNQFRAHVYALRRALAEPSVHWYFWMNDHTYVVAENLRCYVAGLSRTKPIYAGLRLWGPCCGLFNSAAAGYALNRKAVGLLVNRWRDIASGESDEQCDPHSKKAQIALCLKRLDARAAPIDTRDANGAEKFHVYGPIRLATGSIDDWLVNKKKNIVPPETFAADASAVSSDAISFNYVAEKEHRLLDRLLHRDASILDRADATAALASMWPRGREELGGYAHPWPGRNERAAARVVGLLRRLRVCPR